MNIFIAGFGGDPGRVTLAGQSAGAGMLLFTSMKYVSLALLTIYRSFRDAAPAVEQFFVLSSTSDVRNQPLSPEAADMAYKRLLKEL